MPVGTFRIEMINCWDEGAVFKLEGDGSLESRPLLMDSLIPMARNPGTNWLILDCEGLDYIGSPGLGAIVLSHLLLRAKNGGVALVRPVPFVERMLRRTGLDRLMPVMQSVDEAELFFRLNAQEDVPEGISEEAPPPLGQLLPISR
jgi:anti-anti-sigma factor